MLCLDTLVYRIQAVCLLEVEALSNALLCNFHSFILAITNHKMWNEDFGFWIRESDSSKMP
jgi:hypothetical protein